MAIYKIYRIKFVISQASKGMFHTLELRVAKFDTIREPSITNLFINSTWVETKHVQAIFGLTQLTHLINRSYLYLTCLLNKSGSSQPV